jgi:hypothetical protein
MNSRSQRPARSQFLLAAAIFLGPLLAAVTIYYGFPSLLPSGRTNYGDLLNPPRPLPALSLADADGKPVDGAALRGKWSLVYLGAGTCADDCRARLHFSRQLWLALNDKRTKIQRVYVAASATALAVVRTSQKAEHPDLVWLTDASSALQPFFGAGDPGAFYLLDPWGNWVMTYHVTPDVEAAQRDFKGMQKDLKKLLAL